MGVDGKSATDITTGTRLCGLVWRSRFVVSELGWPPPGPTLKFDDDAWQGAFELLLLSAVRMIRLAVPVMEARGGGSILLATSSGGVKSRFRIFRFRKMRTSVSALYRKRSRWSWLRRNCVNQLILAAFIPIAWKRSISKMRSGWA